MEYWILLGTALLSLLVLFLLVRLMGNRQVSQMTMFDYVIGISIGSIAAEMATELEEPFKPLLAMVVYAVVASLFSILASKSLAARKVLNSKPLVLLDKGVLYRENLKKAKLDLSEFLTYCRIGGYFDLGQVQTALLEQNGKVSFLPKSANRPASPQDLGQSPEQEELWLPVLMDGEMLPENLDRQNREESWLVQSLRDAGYAGPEMLMLVLCNPQGVLQFFPMG